MKKKIAWIMLVAIILSLTGCKENVQSSAAQGSSDSNSSGTSAIKAETLNTAEMFSSADREIGYDESLCTKIILSEELIQCTDNSVSIKGNVATIKEEGIYLVSGSIAEGQIVVDCEKTDKVRIILNGASISCEKSAPIYIKQADKVFITLKSNTVNTIKSTGEYVSTDDNNVDATLFSKEDLTINGGGSLEVVSKYGHGIISKDDLAVVGSDINIISKGHGIAGKDCVKITDAKIKIYSEKDGIHGENKDDRTLGYVYIANGDFDITSVSDGIFGSAIQIDDGSFKITTNGGSANSSTLTSGEKNPMWGKQQTVKETDTISAKAIKANGFITINNGTFDIDSSDDALHSNSNVYVNGGTITISSGDDGIHANEKTAINGGDINIIKSYEGIEGQSIDISGGNIVLTAKDDGINAAGGNDQSALNGRPGMGEFAADKDCFINISGGKININWTIVNKVDTKMCEQAVN